MKLLVDGYWWHEGPLSNRMVLREIVRQWGVDYPSDELVIAAPGGDGGSNPVSDNVRVVPTRLSIHPAINFVELPSIAQRHSADAILAFNFAANSDAGVVFLHDVLYQSNPEWFTRIERAYFGLMPILAKRARTVISTSRTECRRIKEYNPKLQRLISCGLGLPTNLADTSAADPGLGLTANGFVLCVGRLNVRKNLARSICAAIQSGVLSEEFPLVIVGERSGRFEEHDGEFRDAADQGLLRIVEGVSDAELKWLYSRCSLFLCLSLDEGFGLPPVEALSLGSAVLASDIPVFRETMGSHARLVDPLDVDAAATAIRDIVRTAPTPPGEYRLEHTWSSVCGVIRDELQRVS